MRRKTFLVGSLAGLIALTGAVTAQARRDDRRDDRTERESRRDNAHQQGLSLNEAVARVRRDSGGRVLSAKAHERRGETTYRVKVLLPNGAVRVYNVDARSGRMD